MGVLMLDYVTVDFETANSYRGSPCAVGLVRVRDGYPVAERRWLMRPPEGVDQFDPFNTIIHGISESMVADEPRWKDVLPSIVEFIGGDVVVAHNAGFDTGVIRYACAADNIEWPQLRFLCTMVLARRSLSLPSYGLPFVLDALGFPFDDHHDPLSDARAVVRVIDGLASVNAIQDLEELAASAGVCIGHMRSGVYKGSVSISGSGGRPVRGELNPDADPGGYLYGRVVVFTGSLLSMTRQVAWDECSRVGAFAEQSTTKRTNVLVIGDVNPSVLRPGSNLTAKARRAFELQDQGQDIEVMTEDDFLRCLDGKPIADAATVLVVPTDSNQREAPANIEPVPAPLRRMPLGKRPIPEPPKLPRSPRSLRRERVPTDQPCSVEGCGNTAAFRTRTKPTWCDDHIAELQRQGGIKPLEEFTHPDDWQLTECLNCTVRAHYRFNYTLEKNRYREPTCRACYWRDWAARARTLQGAWANLEPVAYEQAKSFSEEHGFDYLGPLTAPSLPDDPHHIRCRRCGKISAERLGDIAFGCTCSRNQSATTADAAAF
ncbi:exonuclease domain-containing protein [Mycobacterium paraense]|uniref:exonuclease domain-containing protein n=1 Tax=Mycobacterium paraense TaxID=767916 RepID=UPI000A163F7F|nr:exonuclease domain-containing protein [Mycobacterium paraense]